MENAVGTESPRKKAYSTPVVTIRPLSSLAELLWKQKTEDEGRNANERRTAETLVRTMIVEGFAQEPGEVIRGLSSMGWTTRAFPERNVASVEKLEERTKIPANDGISILLADMRSAVSAPGWPVTRIELEGGPRATLVLVLRRESPGPAASGAVHSSSRWHIRGPITAAQLGAVIHRALQIPAMRGEPRRNQATA